MIFSVHLPSEYSHTSKYTFPKACASYKDLLYHQALNLFFEPSYPWALFQVPLCKFDNYVLIVKSNESSILILII